MQAGLFVCVLPLLRFIEQLFGKICSAHSSKQGTETLSCQSIPVSDDTFDCVGVQRLGITALDSVTGTVDAGPRAVQDVVSPALDSVTGTVDAGPRAVQDVVSLALDSVTGTVDAGPRAIYSTVHSISESLKPVIYSYFSVYVFSLCLSLQLIYVLLDGLTCAVLPEVISQPGKSVGSASTASADSDACREAVIFCLFTHQDVINVLIGSVHFFFCVRVTG